jgi:hypothetical protein
MLAYTDTEIFNLLSYIKTPASKQKFIIETGAD